MDAALQRLRGVLKVQLDWQNGAALIRHTAAVAVGDLIQAIERASGNTRHSYKARPVPPNSPAETGVSRRADREALKTVTRQDLASALLKLLRANQNPTGADGVALFNGIDERIRQLEQSSDLSTPALVWGRGVAQFTLGLGLLLVVFGLAGQMSLALVIGCQV